MHYFLVSSIQLLVVLYIYPSNQVDLAEVKDNYPDAYEKSLAEAIKSDCGGDLKAICLAVLGEE